MCICLVPLTKKCRDKGGVQWWNDDSNELKVGLIKLKRLSLGYRVCCGFLCFCHFPICVLSHISTKIEVCTVGHALALQYCFTGRSKVNFSYLCLMFVLIMLSCLFLLTLLSPAGKGLTSWLSCVWCVLVLLSLSHMVSQVRCGSWLYWIRSFPCSLLSNKQVEAATLNIRLR